MIKRVGKRRTRRQASFLRILQVEEGGDRGAEEVCVEDAALVAEACECEGEVCW